MSLKQTHKPLYVRVAEELRARVKKLATGSILDSESQLATKFGVSIATIREAIRLLSAEGLLQSRQGKGTVILPPKRQAVAVLLDLDVLDPRTSRFYFETALAIREALEAEGIRVRHYYGRATADTPNGPCYCEEFFEDLHAGRLSGVIALATFPAPTLLQAVEKQGIPIVGSYSGFPISIRPDAEQFLQVGIDYALSQGREKIAMLAWNGMLDPEFCNLAQFSKAMAARGLPARPEWHRADLHPNLAGAGWESFREIWTSNHEKPDAILICDDCLFPDALQAISDLKIRVPEDLLIITETRENSEIAQNRSIARLEISSRQTGNEMVEALHASGKAAKPAKPMTQAQPIRRIIPFTLVPLLTTSRTKSLR